jgi:hypothetical protein
LPVRDQQKKVEVLSGGERNRLHLAMTLREGGNVLLLDEPTNDIDVNTLRAWRMHSIILPAAYWSSRTTAGLSTAWLRTFFPLKTRPRWFSLKVTILNMRLRKKRKG